MKRTILLCMMMFCVLHAQAPQTADKAAAPKAVRTVVSDISVQASDKAIILNWKLNPEAIPHIKELFIFRSFERISSIPKALFVNSKVQKAGENLFLVGAVPPETTEYTDTDTEPNKTYYYAVAALTTAGNVYDLIIPALNASLTGISLKEASISRQKQRVYIASKKNEKEEKTELPSPVPTKTPDPLRKKPLPALKIFPETPPTRIQKTSAQKSVQSSENIGTQKKADILPEDTSDKGISGDDYSLFVIVDSFVKAKKWIEAQAELKRFLQINRSEEAAARAYFYLGQSLYFNGNYREALTCFQNSRLLYPVLSKRWITETLDAYRIEGHLID